MLGDAPIWQRVKNRETLSTKFSENTGHGRAFCTQFNYGRLIFTHRARSSGDENKTSTRLEHGRYDMITIYDHNIRGRNAKLCV